MSLVHRYCSQISIDCEFNQGKLASEGQRGNLIMKANTTTFIWREIQISQWFVISNIFENNLVLTGKDRRSAVGVPSPLSEFPVCCVRGV